MSKVTLSAELPTSVESVWKLISSFSSLPDWHPAVANSELSEDGSRRTLHMLGGGSVVEQLETTGEEHRYSCSILESSLAVRDYRGTIAVRPSAEGKGCTVEWSGDFQTGELPDNEAVKIIQGICQMSLDHLNRLFGL